MTNTQIILLDKSTSYQDRVPYFPRTPLSSQSNISLRHHSNVQDGAGTSSPLLLSKSPLATTGNSQIIAMLQQQQSVLQKVLDSQKNMEERQNDMEAQLVGIQGNIEPNSSQCSSI